MSNVKPRSHEGPVEMLAAWEGPAVHEPGVLFDERPEVHLAGDSSALASWLAVTVLSGTIGTLAHDAIKQRALEVLADWQCRFGPSKIDEVKRQLLLELQTHRKTSRITDEELRERLESLFAEAAARSSGA